MSKYRYSQRIGRGGMAEVFLGMQEGIGGFEKLVVIKRIFQHYCEDERFLQMFMDEARLAASIRHPNVVEILDIDRDATGFFIVMEYLSGETLGYVIPSLQARNELPPPQVVCRVAASVASGLHDAHTASDSTGTPQPIVHRDVTPSNVLVGYNGIVKLLDFGVAKAVAGEGETRVRGVKGKLSYLAPEQISNQPVDARTDIFQLGIVMHEMLTGQGLFHASNAHQRVLAVMNREVPPPSQVHPDVPPIVDDIVLSALERDPGRRPASAEVMRERLEEAIQAMGRPASDRDVGLWMRESFAEAHSRRLALERSTASQMRQSRQVVSMPTPAYISSLPSWTPGSSVGDASQTGSSASHPMMAGLGEPSTMTMASESLQRSQQSAHRRRRAWMLAMVALIVVALGTGIAVSQLEGDHDSKRAARTPIDTPAVDPGGQNVPAQPPPRERYLVEIDAEPAAASIELDGTLVGTGSFSRELERDGSTHVLVLSAPGYKPRVVTFRDAPPARNIALAELSTAEEGDEDEVGDSEVEHIAEDPPDKKERAARNDNRPNRRRRYRRSRPSVRRSEPAQTSSSEEEKPEASSEPTPTTETPKPTQPKPPRQPEPRRPNTDNLDPWSDGN